MILLKNVSKSFGNQKVLNNISYDFPKNGFFAICGPSGCGKSTLLNAIYGFTKVDGSIMLNKQKYKYNDSYLTSLRNVEIGYVFQDYKLFECETVEENIAIALDIRIKEKEKYKHKRIDDLLSLIDLKDKKKCFVNTLSGGEKQRLAIARSIANRPKILLADEPTGNLDFKNTQLVMSLLKEISKSTLVILVSHDTESVKHYANKIINMLDGKIIETIDNKTADIKNEIVLMKVNGASTNSHIPFSFCFKHAFRVIGKRKFRTLLMIAVISMGLIGAGLGMIIKDLITNTISESYSSLMDSNQIVMTPKNYDKKKKIIYSLKNEDFSKIKRSLNESLNYSGVCYLNNFNSFFDYYSFSIEGVNDKTLPSLTPQFFNDYYCLCENTLKIYGHNNNELESNEVILAGTSGFFNEMCFQLKIERTLESLENYLLTNEVKINISLMNSSWSYHNEFSLKIVGFCQSNTEYFIHSSTTWNEDIYEYICGFSTTNIINGNSSHPWDLKKIQYLSFKENRDKFLEEVRINKKYINIVADILGDDIYPVLYAKEEIGNFNRVGLFYFEQKENIPLAYLNYYTSSSNCISKVVIGSNNSYSIYPSNLMIGFSKQTFFSVDTNYLETVIDGTSYIKSSDDNIVNIPNNILLGYFAKADGVKFNPSYRLIKGVVPSNYDEIVVSKQIADTLGIASLNKNLYVAFPVNETYLNNGYITRKYVTTSVKIVGISDTEKLEINHNYLWTIMFFQIKLGISAFDLGVDSIAYSVDEAQIDQSIKNFEKSFKEYNFVNPIDGVKDSVESLTNYVETIMIILSISSVIISCILLSICNYLHFLETKKDIGLIRCIGASKKESKKMIYSYSFLISMLSFAISSVELIVVIFILSKLLGTTYGTSSYYLNPFAFLLMACICLGIGFISSIFISAKTNKYTELDCLN